MKISKINIFPQFQNNKIGKKIHLEMKANRNLKLNHFATASTANTLMTSEH